MNRILATLLIVVSASLTASADSLEGKWTISPYYGVTYKFNETFLGEVFDAVGPGITDTNIMGVSFDYGKSPAGVISLSLAYAENGINDAGDRSEVTSDPRYPSMPPLTSTYTWDAKQDVEFIAFTVSALKRIKPQNKVVPYLGVGIGVCHVSGSIKGVEDVHHHSPPGTDQSGWLQTDRTDHYDYDNDYSKFYPVLDARIGLDWHVTEKFILSVEERFVNGLGTMIVGKIVF